MITTGCCSRAWWRTKRNPDITVSDEPSTTNTSACVNEGVRGLDPSLRHRFTEEDHVGFEPTVALQTTDQAKLLPVPGNRVTVGPELGMLKHRRLVELRICIGQPILQFGPSRAISAVQADDGGNVAVQGDQSLGASSSMQSVDVLGDHSGKSGRLQVGEYTVAGIRFRVTDSAPTKIGARPVTLLCVEGADKLAVLHGRSADRGRSAIVRDSRVGRDARTG